MSTNNTFTLKRGEVGAVMEFTLSDEDGTVNLSGKTVTLNVKKRTTLIIDDVPCVIDPDQTANKGKGTYTFDATTAVIAKGEYNAEFKVVSGSNVSFFPKNKADERTYFKIEIQEPLG